MTTTDTPRTDARCYHYDSKWKTMTISPFGEHIEASFSKELERELLTARNDAFNLANALSKSEAEVERLRELLEEAIPTLRIFHYENLSIHLRQCLNNIDSEKATLTPTDK
jgi:hypothetical protein